MTAARDDRGAITAFVAIIALGLLLVTGLVADGGRYIATYRQAGDLAANAARAAAQGVDLQALGEGTVALEPADAQARAADFLASAGHPGAGATSVAGDEVTVTVTLTADALILPTGAKTVTASATATSTRGVDQPSGGP
jgi:Flp pilus assembly protein TadG